MAARRPATACPHGDESIPYPVWPSAGWPLGQDADQDAALRELSAALIGAPAPLQAALLQLTAADISKALAAIPVPSRPKVLRPLGLMINPRTIGQHLCYDVLTRLTRADDHDARHAASALTNSVMADVTIHVFPDEFAFPAAVRNVTEHWSPSLVRVAVWSNGLASVQDARMWLWASEQPWFRPDSSVAEEHIAAIAAAAKTVIAASPGFRLFGDPDQPVAALETGTDIEDTEHADATSPAPIGTQDAPGTKQPDSPPRPAADEDANFGATAASGPALAPHKRPGSDTDVPAVLRRAGEDLQQALIAAVPAAHRVLDSVLADRPPAAEDLAVLTAARTAFDHAVAALQGAGGGTSVDTGAEVQAALDGLIASTDDAPIRDQLICLRALAAPADNAMLVDALTLAQQRADALVASPAWTAADRAAAVTLATLIDLADPATEATQAMALQQQLVQTHPDLALLAVTAAQLTTTAPRPEAAPAALPSAEAQPAAEAGPSTEAAVDSPPPAESATTSTVTAEDDTAASNGAATAAVGAASTRPAAREQAAAARAADNGSAPAAARSLSSTPVTRPTPATSPATAAEPADPAGAVVSGQVTAHARLIDGVADLIGEQRFGLAAAVAEAAQWTSGQQSTLRIAALADAVRSETGAVDAALRGELIELDTAAVADDSPSALLAVASLLRAALVTGEPTTGAVLTELAARVEPNLADVAEQVGRRALQGALVVAPPLTVLADVTEVERSLRTVSDAARAMLRPRTMRFKRATDIAKTWMAADGLLGRPLTIAANDDRDGVNEVATAIRRLGDTAHVRAEIDDLDRRYKGMSGKPIEGSGRQDLVNLVQEAIQTLAAWTEAVLSLQRSSTAQTWSTGEISDMRATVLSRRDDVLAALTAQAERPDPLLAAASRAAVASLTRTFAVLEGAATLPSREPMPAFALTAELLKVPGAVADTTLGRVTVPAGTTVEQLLDAAQRTWADAIDAQVTAENFDAADYLLNSAAGHQLPGLSAHGIGTGTAAAVAAAEHAVRAELTQQHDQLSAALRRARTNNEVSEEQAGELTGLLRDADTTATRNLASVRATLDRVADLLPLYRAESARRLSERLAKLPGVEAATVDRVTRLIGTGELSTAEELIYFLEIGEDVPEVAERRDLQAFFPSVPDALPRGLTDELVAAVRSRSKVPGCDVLDFGRLSPDLAELAAVALNNWRRLANTAPEGRLHITERDLLLPALRLVGVESTRIRRLDDLPRGRDRRFIDVVDLTINGKALVPAFGSKLGGRLRVLLAWGQPSAELLLSHADQDNSDDSLLIAYFGTMSPQNRRELAQQAGASSRTAPVVVLDDAALAYLAAHGNRQMDATMSVLLPFSNINPYVSKKRGLVAEEMFYGRDAERKSVLNPDGTQLLYGGRGLGKSALLRSAGQMFESQGAPGERISLYLSLDTLSIRAGSAIGPEAIWDALLRDLVARGLITLPRRQSSRIKPHEQVRAGVLAWLEVDPRRRLLILLDESDRFFESDAPEFFETNRLKELGLSTDSRIKVVFAGLHSVQRYAKSARNGPFSHLAQRPTVIGPLRPQFATNLLTRPLQALGYRFSDDDLVNRVLAYCSYQPFLLQMFGSRLVATMHAQRGPGIPDAAPPYVITRADVVAVESHADLKADISAAFHDTLHLDPRYNVIANVLAHHAHESGLDARLSDVELREECLAWWQAGFASLDVEGFRAYLQEMVGLGVLAPNNDGRGWHLRSPNVLQMIGSKDDVVTQLVGAETVSVPDEFIALETRAELPDGRRSPLTAGQSDDVLGDHANQVRVVLGSPATGITDAAQAVRLAADLGNRFTVPMIVSRRQFEDELSGGRPGERRVVLTDLVTLALRDEACDEALTAALERRPEQPGVTRSAVIVAGPEQMSLWQRVLSDGGRTPALGTVTLRRYDRQTLRVWALDSQKFSVTERLERLLEVTGGWPMLVEKAARLVAAGVEEGEALRRVAEELASPDGAAAFVDAVGITADEELVKAFTAVLSLVDADGVALADLVAAASMGVDDGDTAVACLQALGAFDVDGDGVYRPEPLLVRSWIYRA